MFDQVQLNFNQDAVVALNVLLAFVLFGVALNVRADDFRRVLAAPRAFIVGLTGQLILLPLLTFILVRVLAPPPQLALGMLLVAACPGGSVSNFFARVAGGNAALSISLSAATSSVAFLATPFNVAFWASQVPATRALLQQVHVEPLRMLLVVVFVLVLPTVAGCWLATHRPDLTRRINRPVQRLSMLVFAAFVVLAFAANWQVFVRWFDAVVGLVFVHNAVALLAGYGLARAARLGARDARSVSIEVGIQNTALGLGLIFTFFDGLGGAALIAAWWGIWHLISGAALAKYWSTQPVPALRAT